VPLPPVARILGLLALCWWIPAILAPSFLLGPDLAAHPAAGPARTATHATSGPWVAETTLLLALLLAARLGLSRATRRT